MTLSEFKAWFEGFTESIEGKAAPTQKQWAKIKEKVGQINGAPVTQTVYIDRYVKPYWDYWRPYWTALSSSGGATAADRALYASNASYAGKGESVTQTFDSLTAMRDLGRMEAVN